MKYNYFNEVSKASAKHSDLSMYYLDDDLIFRTRILVQRLNEIENDVWDWPWNYTSKENAEKFKGHIKYFGEIILHSVKNSYVFNAHMAAGMMELIEQLIDGNMKYLKEQFKEKFIALRDEASTIYVCIKMFDLNKIVGH